MMCPWCRDPRSEEVSEDLCRRHEAEYLGETLSEMDRRDDEERADLS